MPIKLQIELNSRACYRDIMHGHFKNFWFHFKGILRALKEMVKISIDFVINK
jgi:hypothetical protein